MSLTNQVQLDSFPLSSFNSSSLVHSESLAGLILIPIPQIHFNWVGRRSWVWVCNSHFSLACALFPHPFIPSSHAPAGRKTNQKEGTHPPRLFRRTWLGTPVVEFNGLSGRKAAAFIIPLARSPWSRDVKNHSVIGRTSLGERGIRWE